MCIEQYLKDHMTLHIFILYSVMYAKTNNDRTREELPNLLKHQICQNKLNEPQFYNGFLNFVYTRLIQFITLMFHKSKEL